MNTAIHKDGTKVTEHQIARAIGLTDAEYANLSHSGLGEVLDDNGRVLKYFMVVSKNNPENILRKN